MDLAVPDPGVSLRGQNRAAWSRPRAPGRNSGSVSVQSRVYVCTEFNSRASGWCTSDGSTSTARRACQRLLPQEVRRSAKINNRPLTGRHESIVYDTCVNVANLFSPGARGVAPGMALNPLTSLLPRWISSTHRRYHEGDIVPGIFFTSSVPKVRGSAYFTIPATCG